jgi:endonuclease/exonuclease/phosphatase family metal-dependent hydrolase
LAEALTGAYTAVDAPHGPRGTYSSFEVGGEQNRRIDYVFSTNGVDVERFGTLTDQWNGHYPSDHLPVLADVQF